MRLAIIPGDGIGKDVIAEGVKVRAIRGMIAEVRARGEPVKDDG